MIVINMNDKTGFVFLSDKMAEKNGKKEVKTNGTFLKVKRPTLLLTLYLLTH